MPRAPSGAYGRAVTATAEQTVEAEVADVLALARRFEPVLRYTQGELFLPPTLESWAIVALPPASVRRPVQWVVHKTQLEVGAAFPGVRNEGRQVDCVGGRHQLAHFRPGTRRYNADASTYGSTGIGRWRARMGSNER
jgi:hypothetical protein